MDKTVDNQSRIVTLSYLAGVMDSEGTAFIYKTTSRTARAGFLYQSKLVVEMVDPGPVKLFCETFDGSSYIIENDPPHKTSYRWEVRGQEAARVAAQLLPFSHNDRKKAAMLVIIDFGKTILPRAYYYNGLMPMVRQYRELLRNRCCAINAKGSEANNQSAADLQAIKAMKLDTAQLNLWDE